MIMSTFLSLIIVILVLSLPLHTRAQSHQSLIHDWQVTCKDDPIHDTRMCYGYKRGLMIFLHDTGRTSVRVPGDKYPGNRIYVRVGHNKPHSAGEDGWTSTEAKSI